jgi:putative peptidoglycan lipid II flippase
VVDVAITITLSAAAFFSCMILLGARRRHFKSGGG